MAGPVRTLARSFNGGEVTPEFWGQIANAAFQTGLATCRNFIVKPHGPIENRAGTAFVRAAKVAGRRVRVVPFTYSTDQTYVLEVGHHYIRFHTQGATLESSPGTPYEVATSYDEADLFDLHFVQSADVFTIVHPNYAPAELRRLGALSWTLVNISFASALTAPAGVSATPSVVGATTYEYQVTAVDQNGLQQSLASSAATCTNDLFTSGNYNTIAWSAVTGALRYKVYKRSNGSGLFGYIGQTEDLSFRDDNIAADLSATPPIDGTPFPGAGDYPGAVSYYEQRRWFAGSTNKPQTFWATRSGTESDMSYSIPSRDDDALTFRVAAREANTIRHAVPLTNLVLLTSSAEWRVTSINTDAITPSSVSVKPQSFVGASNAQPVVINNNLLFAAARGGHVRELAYNWQAQGYVTGDISLRAPHLFDTFDIVDMAYAKSPQPVVWAVSTSGKLLGLTYVPEQSVGAWHQHDTDGVIESCAVVAEGAEDRLYLVVRREVDGSTVRYIERLSSRLWTDAADAFFVDCGATYSGAATTSISGLSWLEGKTVSILADGAVHPQRVVSGGAVTLDNPASKAQVGLPITADIQTLPMVLEQAMGAGFGRPKNIDRVWLRVYGSSAVKAGPTFDKLREFKQRTTEPYGVAPRLRSDEIQIDLDPQYQSAGQVCVRQDLPLPVTIISLTAEATVTG